MGADSSKMMLARGLLAELPEPPKPYWFALARTGRAEALTMRLRGGRPNRSGRSPDGLKKNPACETMRREAEEDVDERTAKGLNSKSPLWWQDPRCNLTPNTKAQLMAKYSTPFVVIFAVVLIVATGATLIELNRRGRAESVPFGAVG
jgi:hypothetical protein